MCRHPSADSICSLQNNQRELPECDECQRGWRSRSSCTSARDRAAAAQHFARGFTRTGRLENVRQLKESLRGGVGQTAPSNYRLQPAFLSDGKRSVGVGPPWRECLPGSAWLSANATVGKDGNGWRSQCSLHVWSTLCQVHASFTLPQACMLASSSCMRAAFVLPYTCILNMSGIGALILNVRGM